MTIVKDPMNKNTLFVLDGTTPVGYVECFAPGEWKSFNANGEFQGWYQSKREAIAAL